MCQPRWISFAVNIRTFVLRAASLSGLVELGSLTREAAAFLDASVRAGLNTLIAGGTQAVKTTLLNCMAAAIPGGERVVSVEEVFELRFPHAKCEHARCELGTQVRVDFGSSSLNREVLLCQVG